MSVSTLKRAQAGLRAKGLVTVQWNAKRESHFTVATKSLAPQKNTSIYLKGYIKEGKGKWVA